jgi:hypothetical protein
MTDIGELVVRIKADATQLQQELRNATGVAKQSAGEMEGAFASLKDQLLQLVPALSIAAFVEFGKNAIETASNLENMANRIGFSASTLSAMQPMLAKTGTDVNAFAMSINLMNNQIGLAVQGNAAAIQKFDQLGLSVTKLKSLSPEDQFYAIADALSKLGTQYEQTEAGRAIFGRGFAALIPLIKESNGELADTVQKLKDTGEAMSDENIKRVHEFGVALEDAGIRAKNAFIDAFAAILRVKDMLGEPLPNAKTAGNPMTSGVDWSKYGETPNDWEAKSKSMGYVTSATFRSANGEQYGPSMQDKTAKGSNTDLVKTDTKTAAKEATDGVDKLTEAQMKAAHMAALMENQISSSLASIALNYKNFGSIVTGVLQNIAKEIIELNITNPIVSSVSSYAKGFNVMSMLPHFASGGVTGSGPIVVGDGGEAEVWTPPQSGGTITPMSKLGGQAVTVQQTIVLNQGATEQTVAQLQNLVPAIMSATHASVMQAFQMGGPASQIVGLRS